MSDIEWKNEYKKILMDNSVNEQIVTDMVSEHMPRSMYRYMRFDKYWQKNIYDGQIFLSPASELNDPYDCLYSINTGKYIDYRKKIEEISNEEIIFKSIKDIANSRIMRRLARYIVYFKKHTRIACFSEDVYSILMWSHYANKHKGFCIEYDFHFINELKDLISPVVYSNDRYDLSKALAYRESNKMLYNSFFFKFSEWSYEKEWRIAIPEAMFDNGEFYFNGLEGIKGIYFGYSSVLEYSKEIAEIINWAKDKGIRVYIMLLSERDYTMFPLRLV